MTELTITLWKTARTEGETVLLLFNCQVSLQSEDVLVVWF